MSWPEVDDKTRVANWWNRLATQCGLRKIRVMSAARVKKYLGREGLDEHRHEIAEIISHSSFLCGKSESGWKIDFSWLIANDSNYLKVLEGNYVDEQDESEEDPFNTDEKRDAFLADLPTEEEWKDATRRAQ